MGLAKGSGNMNNYLCGLGDALTKDFDLEVPEVGVQCHGHND